MTPSVGTPETIDTTCDDFLGGRLRLIQPANGYRAGVDPVLLAASVPASPGQTVLDLGCGVGTAALCLATRVPNLALSGLEQQPSYAALARRNAALNDLSMTVHDGALPTLPEALRDQQFDHVIANPPYYDRDHSTATPKPEREIAMGEATPLSDWVATAAKRTRPKGYVTIIQRADRLPALLTYMAQHLGSLELLPLIPRPGRDAKLVLLRGRRGGRAAFRLHAPWCLHDGQTHVADAENYTASTASVLREAAPLVGFS